MNTFHNTRCLIGAAAALSFSIAAMTPAFAGMIPYHGPLPQAAAESALNSEPQPTPGSGEVILRAHLPVVYGPRHMAPAGTDTRIVPWSPSIPMAAKNPAAFGPRN